MRPLRIIPASESALAVPGFSASRPPDQARASYAPARIDEARSLRLQLENLVTHARLFCASYQRTPESTRGTVMYALRKGFAV
jgi:hypothetical protein